MASFRDFRRWIICDEGERIKAQRLLRIFPVVPEARCPHDLTIFRKKTDELFFVIVFHPFKKTDKRKQSMLSGEKFLPCLACFKRINSRIEDIILCRNFFFGTFRSDAISHPFENSSAIFMNHHPGEVTRENSLIITGDFKKIRAWEAGEIQSFFQERSILGFFQHLLKIYIIRS